MNKQEDKKLFSQEILGKDIVGKKFSWHLLISIILALIVFFILFIKLWMSAN